MCFIRDKEKKNEKSFYTDHQNYFSGLPRLKFQENFLVFFLLLLRTTNDEEKKKRKNKKENERTQTKVKRKEKNNDCRENQLMVVRPESNEFFSRRTTDRCKTFSRLEIGEKQR